MGNIEDEHLTIKQLVSGGEQKVAGTTGRWSYFHAKTNVKLGGWYNASKSYMDCDATGTVTGRMSAHNMELRMPAQNVQWGNYSPVEVNLVFQSGSAITHGREVVFASYNVSGDQAAIDAWEDEANTKGGVFSFDGLTGGDGDIFDATGGPAAADAALAILVNGTKYWLSLSTTK